MCRATLKQRTLIYNIIQLFRNGMIFPRFFLNPWLYNREKMAVEKSQKWNIKTNLKKKPKTKHIVFN